MTGQRGDPEGDILEPCRAKRVESTAWGAKSPELSDKIGIHTDATYIVCLSSHKYVAQQNSIVGNLGKAWLKLLHMAFKYVNFRPSEVDNLKVLVDGSSFFVRLG